MATFNRFHFVLMIVTISFITRSIAFPGSTINIIGGQNATEGEFPYQILVKGVQGYLFTLCGGTLVTVNDTQVVLTAFSCAGRQRPECLTLVAGELDRSVESGYEQYRNVTRIINFPSQQQSLTMLVLSKPFELNSHVQPIVLPKKDLNEEVGNVTASGWGSIKITDASMGERVEHPNLLQKVNLEIMPYEECLNQAWVGDEPVLPNEEVICTRNDYVTGTTYCFGDHGGPVVKENEQGKYLTGIMLYSYYCSQGGREQVPGLNIKVSYFLDWIEGQIKNV